MPSYTGPPYIFSNVKTMHNCNYTALILLPHGTKPGHRLQYTCTRINCHIKDSHKVPKERFEEVLEELKYKEAWCQALWLRPLKSLEAEWGVHNVLYRLGLFRSRTKDVDLNYPQRWSWLYRITWALTKWIAR